MASSPLRNKSGDNRMVGPGPIDYRNQSINNSYMKYSGTTEKENAEPGTKFRSSHSPNYFASTAAQSRYLTDQMRHSQYVSRYSAMPPPEPVMVTRVVSAHQDYFLSELTSEVNELRSRQRDYAALQDQFRYLQDQYKTLQFEKQQFESDCLNKIAQDRQEVDLLIRELDQARHENMACEDEQMRLLEQIAITEKDVGVSNNELADVRHACSQQDMGNLNLRKDNEYNEKLVAEQKDISNNNYQELTRLKDIFFNLEKDCDAQAKRVDILHTEISNNEQRIASINDLLSSKEEAISRTQFKISEAYQQIQDLKYTLNKLDGELGYFENQNEQHKAAQSQMFKANEYEYMNGKDNNLKLQEYEITLNKLIQDEKQVSYEIDRLKQHSDQMLKDQVDLQAEIDALDRHMANLNNQNYCLQKELEEFVQADDQVRRNLDRKNKVENIRQRVDDVIARSQAEVDHQRKIIYQRDASPAELKHMERMDRLDREQMELMDREHMDRMNRARSANNFSPPRDTNVRRTAWGPENDAGNQMSFGRDKYEREREARFAIEKENQFRTDYKQGHGSPLRRSPRSRSYGKGGYGGKAVSFAP